MTHTIPSALTAIALLAASAVPASPAPMAKPGFDGAWSVLIVTEQGKCDRAYRYPVKIENGAVTVWVARGNQSANGTGTMSATDGAGTWTAATGECSGTWTAERRS